MIFCIIDSIDGAGQAGASKAVHAVQTAPSRLSLAQGPDALCRRVLPAVAPHRRGWAQTRCAGDALLLWRPRARRRCLWSDPRPRCELQPDLGFV